MRVAIAHDGFVPRYRVPLYERLASDGAADYVVFHGSPPDGAGSIAAAPPFAFPNVEVRNRQIRVGPKRLVHQHLVGTILTGGYDAVVLGDFARFTSSLALQPLLRLRRTPVILWGQVTDKDEDLGSVMRVLTRANHRLKLARARRADAYLAYTAGGAMRLAERGMRLDRVFVVRNTLDMDAQRRLRDELAGIADAGLRARLGLRPDSVVLLYVGRVYRAKRVPELLEAVEVIRRTGLLAEAVEVVIAGDGPQLPEVRTRAAGMEDVHVLGEVADQRAIARLMRVSAAVVIPGAVGAGDQPCVRARRAGHHAAGRAHCTDRRSSISRTGRTAGSWTESSMPSPVGSRRSSDRPAGERSWPPAPCAAAAHSVSMRWSTRSTRQSPPSRAASPEGENGDATVVPLR